MDNFSHVGIDVSKATLEIAMRPDAKTFKISNDQVGLAALLTKLPPPDQCSIVLGYESLSLQDIARTDVVDAGRTVCDTN